MPERLQRDGNGRVRPVGFSLARSFSCALRGIAAASKERNFRIELCFAVLAITLGFVFGIPIVEWLVVVVCIGVVLAFECLNTAIEAIVDLVSPDWHSLAKIAKDAAAGATMMVSVASFVVGVILFAPRILACLGLL